MEGSGGRDWWAFNRDLDGRAYEPWLRRAGLLLLLALSLTALSNVFGQRAHSSSATAPSGVLSLNAPSKARGGDIFQARFEVRASSEIRRPLLVLDPGWLDELTQNTSSPEPYSERTDNGRIVREYDTIPARPKLTVWLQFQINPTHAGKTDQDVELWDGDTRITHLEHSLTV